MSLQLLMRSWEASLIICRNVFSSLLSLKVMDSLTKAFLDRNLLGPIKEV